MAKKIVVKTQTKEVKLVLDEIKIIGEVYEKLLKILPSFDITSTKILPYGLKTAHSVSCMDCRAGYRSTN